MIASPTSAGPSTCSASEAVINGLRGIDVEVATRSGGLVADPSPAALGETIVGEPRWHR